jgi:F-type H+-transporting ATPase subunit a
MIPFNYAVTSHLSMTFFAAFTVWFTTVSLCFSYHGFAFLNHFIIRGIPRPLVSALIMIELLSYIIRAASLSLRLFANIFSGHILLHVISSGLYELLYSCVAGFQFSNFFAHIGGLICFSILVIFEMLVGLLQAYIFTLLSLIYLSDI